MRSSGTQLRLIFTVGGCDISQKDEIIQRQGNGPIDRDVVIRLEREHEAAKMKARCQLNYVLPDGMLHCGIATTISPQDVTMSPKRSASNTPSGMVRRDSQ